MEIILILVSLLLVARVVVESRLITLNRREVERHADSIPPAYREVMDDPTYRKAVDYTQVKNCFGQKSLVFDAIVLAIVLFSGILPWLYAEGQELLGSGFWARAATLFGISFIIGLVELPWSWWSTFKIEGRFGFNKSNQKLWLVDQLKETLVGALMTIPLIALLLWLATLPYWWIWAALVMILFQVVMAVAYPLWIMPLFNKFEPLKDETLRERLMEVAQKAGFQAKTILVMDGSRRSGHSNAFFTGFGKFRRIVLYDTLVDQLEPRELEGVLAHEIGHYKLGHIPKMLIFMAIGIFAGFALIGWLAQWPPFVESFGFNYVEGDVAPAFLLFSLMGGLVFFWLSPVLNAWMRKNEYEADAFACRVQENDPSPLVHSLRKLHRENLSNLTPHPLYSAFHYNHPTLHEREASLKREFGAEAVS